ncbi:cupin domain-containing protein [Colletotrichum chrysophilum]|uniref:Cupin domain-containing protein n=1 Tax=Colletotrichum chrysophilum TaxID=1836956 RepID=A0AAD8ZYN2_9PEZI|nr:cupin domain-containing protein [Colletotrichum chrysophilum]
MTTADGEQIQPETYFVKRTEHCPNSDFPVLVYRGVLGTGDELDEDEVSEKLQQYGWVKKGTWGTITLKHFHPNTHECYGSHSSFSLDTFKVSLTELHPGIFQGRSELVFGEGGSDPAGSGVRCWVRPGDVVVVPAGVAHASVADEKAAPGEKEYRYVGVYPEESPQWRSEMGRKPLQEKQGLVEEVEGVGLPRMDPLYGVDGPLIKIWKAARG